MSSVHVGNLKSGSRTVPAYEALAADLKNLGVDTIFCLMSDDTALFVATLDSVGVRVCGARHENTAIAMADGYSAASGKLGVAIIGRGPATANALHAATFASRTGSQVLMIFGEMPTTAGTPNSFGPDSKTFNGGLVLEAAGLRTFRPTSASGMRTMLVDAVAVARQGNGVALLLPQDLQLQDVEVNDTAALPVSVSAPAAHARPTAIKAAVSLLATSRRPLIIAGAGAAKAGAKQVLQQLAEKIGAVLVTSLKGKDLFHDDPFNLGLIGSFSHSLARRLIDQADCILVFGAGLNARTSSFGTSIPQGAPLIQIDAIRTNIGRWHPADVAIVADAKSAAEQLLHAVADRPAGEKPFRSDQVRAELAAFRHSDDFQSAHTSRTLDPRLLSIELDRMLPKQRNLVWDSGNFLGTTVPYLSVTHPDRAKLTTEFASIGLGFGTAIGYAVGNPADPTVLVIGDGAFLMTLGELETTVREDVPLVIVLMNDCAYGAELHFLKLRNMPVAKSVFPDVDFAPVAESFGFQTATIRTMDDLKAVAGLLAKPEGPILLDCKINASVPAPFLSESPGHQATAKSD